MTPDPRPFTLDHLVIAVRDLGAAAESYTRLLGREPSWRGRHPAYGTTNVLYRLDNCYLELLAPAPADLRVRLQPDSTESPWLRALRERLDGAGEGLYAIALGTDDIESAVVRLRERGLAALDPADGDGVDLVTGSRRAWRNARLPLEATRGVVTFLIEHRSPADALPVARPRAPDGAAVAAVDHTVIASADLDACLALWHETFGLDLRLTLDRPDGRRLCFLRLGDSILELAGSASGPPPNRTTTLSTPLWAGQRPAPPAGGGPASGGSDQLWGVAYRVGDVARTVERLRADGIQVSDPRPGNAPGTVVADLKPGFSHDVRTLFIQKDVPA